MDHDERPPVEDGERPIRYGVPGTSGGDRLRAVARSKIANAIFEKEPTSGERAPADAAATHNALRVAMNLTEDLTMDHDERSEKKPKVSKKTNGAKKTTTDKALVTTHGSSSSTTRMIAVAAIVTHPAFEHLLRVDEALRSRLARTMRKKGFYSSSPVVLGRWPGLATPPVLIDGHIRWLAARDAGLTEIPCIIIEFPDEMSALELCIDLQTARRQTSGGSIYRFCERFDSLWKRGGDRRSGRANSRSQCCDNDREPNSSARATARIIGCNYRIIHKVRRIRRDGTPEIRDAVRDDVIGIEKAYRMVREMELGKEENTRNRAADTRAAKRLLAEEIFERLQELPGDMHEKINAAVELYLRSPNDKERG
jgi:ParB family chromosome partitioning protein